MNRRHLFFMFAVFLCVSVIPRGGALAQFNLKDAAKGALDSLSGSGSGGAPGLATEEIIAGLREALKIGTERVVGTIGRADGFNSDPDIHIPLPENLAMVHSALDRLGMGAYGEELELKLNRAAETATPKAKEIFWRSISSMTLDDAQRIYDGPDDAATQYFRSSMSSPLKTEMRPIVDATLAEVGAMAAYDQMMGKYAALPFVPDIKANLTDYALDKALDGIFLYLAREEQAIRRNPAQRSTELLKKVFGGS